MLAATEKSTLNQLLDANRDFIANRNGFANHCPMALCALAQMGASSSRLREFFLRWQEHHAKSETPSGTAITPENWDLFQGDATAYIALQRMFEKWVVQQGCAQVLTAVLPRVSSTVASGAFHALIRLGHAVQVGHAGEIGASLAAFVSQPLRMRVEWTKQAEIISVPEGLQRLANVFSSIRFAGGSIVARVAAAFAHPDFDMALPRPPKVPDLLDQMGAAALQVYWQTDDFIALHLVTALHSARVVFSTLPASLQNTMLADLWLAFCAAYVALGAPPLQMRAHCVPVEDWERLHGLAVDANDDHVIKLVHACSDEARRTGDGMYYAAAQRILARQEFNVVMK